MENGRTRKRRIKTDPWDAFDRLPASVRAAMREGPQQWCPVWVLGQWRRRRRVLGEAGAEAFAAELVEGAHAWEIRHAIPWQPGKRARKGGWVPSPHIAAGATMQRGY